MAIDFGKLGAEMSGAFLKSLGKDYKNVRDYAKVEFEHFASWLRTLIEQSVAGNISEEQAKLLLQMQHLSIRNVFLTIEGLGLLAVEAAINAAIDVARAAVNTALNFALL